MDRPGLVHFIDGFTRAPTSPAAMFVDFVFRGSPEAMAPKLAAMGDMGPGPSAVTM